MVAEVQVARALAKLAFKGVKDKQGEPYVGHLFRVAEAVPLIAKPAAYLHDVLEDTDLTAEDLIEFGIEQYTIQTIQILTHGEEDTYEQYIEKIIESYNVDALVIKMADIRDNMRPGGSKARQERLYKPALEKLKRAFYMRGYGEDVG